MPKKSRMCGNCLCWGGFWRFSLKANCFWCLWRFQEHRSCRVVLHYPWVKNSQVLPSLLTPQRTITPTVCNWGQYGECSIKGWDTVGEPRSAAIFVSHMPAWKAKNPGQAYARNPGLGASK